MEITPEDAAKALQEIKLSQAAMRSAIRSHRGHLFLWLWGAIWCAMATLNWIDPFRFATANNLLTAAGVLASFAIGIIQGRQINSRVDRRFVGVVAAVLLFGYGVIPLVTHSFQASYAEGYAVSMLTWMLVYVIGGIWFDTYWLWVGITVTALILAGYLIWPALFWGFMLLAGLMLVGTGFYVRHFWR